MRGSVEHTEGGPRERGTPTVAIIGAGVSGICLGIRLRRAGITSFTIYEKSDGVGGTWRDNTYPGASCDVPSMFYCFSFEQKTDWSRKFAPQEEILEYLEHCTDEYGVRPHIRFGIEIAEARFDEREGCWRCRTTDGEEIVADILVSGTGQLNRPYVPAIAGLESFRGTRFHSARWNHEHDLEGERVAVIGNAASAIQFIPQIAPRVARLHIFQRSANWMIPRNDRLYTEREKWRFRHVPLLARFYRYLIWGLLESRWPAFRSGSRLGRLTERVAIREMRARVSDPRLRQILVPDYPVGAKRILISDDYYPSLQRENVEVVTEPIRRVTEHGIVTEDGRESEVDTIILATGFRSTEFLSPVRVAGRGGRDLNTAWRDGAEAYLGMMVSGFPNFFMLYGPNTNLGHNSIIFMIECQVRWILRCIQRLSRDRGRVVDVRPEAMQRWNDEAQKALQGTVWGETDRSWYKTESGRITNNWPYSTITFWWRTRRPDWNDLLLEPVPVDRDEPVAIPA